MRGIELPPEAMRARARGVNELRERIPVLTGIHLEYELTVPAGSRETVDRALARHVSKCPTARSLDGAVDISWEAQVHELPDEPRESGA